jgi:hypothetical protein
MFKDLRVHKRFRAREGACASFMNPEFSPSTRIGQVLDMSRGGIALKYLSNREGYEKGQPILIELFNVSNPVLTTGEIPCRVVYDVPLTDNPPDSMNIRRCGMAFGRMSNLQSCHVDHFIATCVCNPGERPSAGYQT